MDIRSVALVEYKDFIVTLDELCYLLIKIKDRGFFDKNIYGRLLQLRINFVDIVNELRNLDLANSELNNKYIIDSCYSIVCRILKNIEFVIQKKFLHFDNIKKINLIKLDYVSYRLKKQEERKEVQDKIHFYRKCIDMSHDGYFERNLYDLLLKISSILRDRYRIDFFNALETIKFNFIDPIYIACNRLEVLFPKIIDYLSNLTFEDEENNYIRILMVYENSNLEKFKNTLIEDINGSLIQLLRKIESFIIEFGQGIIDIGTECIFSDVRDTLFRLLEYYACIDRNNNIEAKSCKINTLSL